MQNEIIIAGFGGQGVLFVGTLLAQTALEEGKFTTWYPSYGAEMRGGTANAAVIISDHTIGSPVIGHPSILIALNAQSFRKFASKVKPNGLIVANSSLVTETSFENIKIISIPVTELADKKLNDVRVANIIAAGALIKATGILQLSSAKKACETILAEKKSMIPINQEALEIGFSYK